MSDAKLVPDSVPPPVIVLAAPRSFSSLFATMLGQHPELYGVPEFNLFQCGTMAEFNSGLNPNGSQKSPFWGTMRHGLLRAVAEIYGGEQTIESVRMAERWVKVREERTSGEVFREICQAVAPRRIVEKSPGILRHRASLDRLFEACPDAQFIHLLRHPVGQCESMLKAKGGIGVLLAFNAVDYNGDKPALEPQILWHDAQVQILRFLDRLPDDRFLTVRGEEFLNTLDEALPALCRWLGVSDDPDSVAAMRHPETSPFACEGPANARLGNDINFLRSPALADGAIAVPDLDGPLAWRSDGASLHPDVASLARELGY